MGFFEFGLLVLRAVFNEVKEADDSKIGQLSLTVRRVNVSLYERQKYEIQPICYDLAWKLSIRIQENLIVFVNGLHCSLF